MQSHLYRRVLLVFGILFFLSAACSIPTSPRQPQSPNLSQTLAVQTIDAMMTQVSGSSITSTPGIPPSGSVDQPTQAAPTQRPSFTPTPTSTRVILPSATATATTICDQAQFLGDISIPDGSVLQAGAKFTKTWRLKNVGSCTWTPEYALVFDSGDGMNGPSYQKVGAYVEPGQYIDLSVSLKAPGAPGQYRGNWKMRNAAGVLFGLGPTAERFYVVIKVVSAPDDGASYDFTANVCAAEWSGNGKALPCIGKDGSADGFVLYQTAPVLESGYVDDQPGLLTNPPRMTNSIIRGKYPAYRVKANDHFYTTVGCEHNAKNCNVRFQLDYQIDNSGLQTLKGWNEAYEGQFTQVDVDLSSLAGKNVKFILTVLANGDSNGDRALWLLPEIKNQPVTPTVTPTRTVTVTPTVTVTEGYPYPYP